MRYFKSQIYITGTTYPFIDDPLGTADPSDILTIRYPFGLNTQPSALHQWNCNETATTGPKRADVAADIDAVFTETNGAIRCAVTGHTVSAVTGKVEAATMLYNESLVPQWLHGARWDRPLDGGGARRPWRQRALCGGQG